MDLNEVKAAVRNRRAAFYLLAVLFIGAVVIAEGTAIRTAIIRLAEVCIVHRHLTPAPWHRRMVKLATFCITMCPLAAAALLFEKGIKAQLAKMPRGYRVIAYVLFVLFAGSVAVAAMPLLRRTILKLTEVFLIHRPLNRALWYKRMGLLSSITIAYCLLAVLGAFGAKSMKAILRGGGVDKSEMLVYLTAMVLCFICYYYYDIAANTRHGIDLWDALREGKILKYYSHELNVEWRPGTHDQMAYEFPVYLTLAIWDIPLYIFEKLTHTGYMYCTPMVIYSKGVLIVFFLASMRVMKEICKEMGFSGEKANECVFFWITSALVIEPLFVICQYDIFCIFFTLMGYLSYLKGRNKQFIFYFGIALCYKSFSIMVFLPLLVYREKRVLFILRNLIVSAIPLICFKLMFIGDKVGREFQAAHMKWRVEDAMTGSMRVPSGFVFANVGVSFFIAGWIVFLLYLFTCKTFNKKYIAPISVIGFGLFFTMVQFHPYWIILISPYVALLTFQSENHKASMIFETSMAASITVFLFYVYFWCYNANVISYSVLKKTNQFSLDFFLQEKEPMKAIAFALYIVSMVLFMLYSCKKDMPHKEAAECYTVKGIKRVRLSINLFLCLFQISLPFFYKVYTIIK